MNLFTDSDRRELVAPPSLFDREILREEHGDWGHQLLRAATAMEMLAQIRTASKILYNTNSILV